MQGSLGARTAALIPDMRTNVNLSKGIFSSEGFVSYLKNGSLKSRRLRNSDHRKYRTDDTA